MVKLKKLEAYWIIPGVILTAGVQVFLFSYAKFSDATEAVLGGFSLWLLINLLLGAAFLGVITVKMAIQRLDNPLTRLIDAASERRQRIAFIACGVALSGLNLSGFMAVKGLLNQLVPFSADPVLASMDRAIFFGTDGWRLLSFLNSNLSASFYHRGWFIFLLLSLILTLDAKATAEKTALMITYFALWSVVGPVVHLIFPAGGPIFYDRLGWGNEFAEMQPPDTIAQVASFLWRVYGEEDLIPGGGISAMPSLHVATSVWCTLVFQKLHRRFFALATLVTVLISLLSVSLGWHYAMDGIVGGALTIAIFYLTLRFTLHRQV